jgi:hypothetical protein
MLINQSKQILQKTLVIMKFIYIAAKLNKLFMFFKLTTWKNKECLLVIIKCYHIILIFPNNC